MVMQKQKSRGCLYCMILLLAGMLGFAIRWRGIECITADMESCLIPWSMALKTGQGPSSLLAYDGDYNMPYITVLWLLNYLQGRTSVKIKLFSVLFEYLGAVAAGLIVAHFAKEEKKGLWFTAACTAVLFYPSAILNGAYWGQCDFIYVAFLLYMIWAILNRHFSAAMVLLGCALSFKLQAVLILPVLLIFWWKERRFSGVCFLLVPFVMEILCIPAILGGYSVSIPFSVYARQLGRYPYMYVYYPNFWALFREARYYIFSSVAVLCVLAGLFVFAVAVIRKKTEITKKQWIEYAVWTSFFMMCFLPCMHERYGMLLETLAIIYAFLNPKTWWSAVIIGSGSYISYLQTTFGKSIIPDQWIAAAYLLAFGFFTCQMIKNWNNNEAEKIRGKHFSRGRMEALAIENKVMDFVNRHILPLVVSLLTILAVVIRKPMIEYTSPDYLANLIDIQGNYHTPLYMFVMHVLTASINGFLKDKTLFFLVKMLCVAADLFAAGMAAFCFYNLKIRKSIKSVTVKKADTDYDIKLQAVIVYAVMLFMPAVLLNSSLWAHLDSISVGLMFGSYYLCVKGKREVAGGMAGLACAFLTYYTLWLFLAVLVALILPGKKEKIRDEKKSWQHFAISFMLIFLLSSLTGMFYGNSMLQSISKFLYSWADIGGWVLYPLLVFGLLLCLYSQRWIPVWILLELAVVLDWGEFLYRQMILPHAVCNMLYLTAGIWAIVLIWKTNRCLKG